MPSFEAVHARQSAYSEQARSYERRTGAFQRYRDTIVEALPVSQRLCVPKTLSMSCDQPIFMDQPSDPSVPPDAVVRKTGRFG